MSNVVLEVLVCAARSEARGVLSFELRAPDGSDLPAFTAGSHIDVHLPNGMVRNYSLINSPSERHRYVIAISLDANSRGGSRYLFEQQLVGQFLKISAPRNNFALIEDSNPIVLIGGGIGITPLHSMILRLEALGKPWTLHYGARARDCAAFREEFEVLEAARPGCVRFNFDAEHGAMLDVSRIVTEAPANAHLYCCGPAPMLALFQAAAANRAPETVHLEYFTARATTPTISSNESFTVVLASTGKEYEIPAGESILEVLLNDGVNAGSSCRAGECGSCIVGVLEGEPHHKDYVLSANEKASNRMMTICVSGSKSKRLVLDL